MCNQHINREKAIELVEEVLKGLIELKEDHEKSMELDKAHRKAMRNVIDALDKKIDAVNNEMEASKDVFDSMGNFVQTIKDVFLAFEAKMDARFEELAGKFDTDFKELAEDFDQEWKKIEAQLNALEEKMIAEFQSLRAEE